MIGQGETVPDPHAEDLGPGTAARGPETGGHVTGGPDLAQEDGHVLPEDDLGIGNYYLFRPFSPVR